VIIIIQRNKFYLADKNCVILIIYQNKSRINDNYYKTIMNADVLM